MKHRDLDNEVESDSKLIDIACEVRATSPKAFLLYDGAREAWVPQSQCERNDDGTVTMPEWIAKEEGFL